MAKRKLPPKMWIYAPRAAPKASVPEAVKTEVSQQGQRLIDEWKPQYIKAPPEDYQFNYIVDLFTKWHRNYFYFVAKYECPGPTARSRTIARRSVRVTKLRGSASAGYSSP